MKVLLFFSDIQITFRDLKSMHTTEYYSAPAIYTFFSVFGTLLYIASRLFLYFWQFAYAENPERGLITALNKSRCFFLAAVPTLILFYFLEFIYLKIISIVNVNYLIPVYSALRNWIGFTIYYMATGDGINSKILKKTFQKINEKEVERAKNEAYNIGGNYVYATNTPAENDKTDE